MPKHLTALNFFIYITHIFIHIKGCTTTELNIYYNVEPFNEKLLLN